MRDRLRFTSPNAGRSANEVSRVGAAGARTLRVNTTDAERIIWSRLRGLKQIGLHFRRQAPFEKYVTDFACHRAKIIVELDGSQHGFEQNQAHDRKRTAYLNSRGYKVIRFWNVEVFKDLDRVVEDIVRQASPPPVALTRADLPARGR